MGVLVGVPMSAGGLWCRSLLHTVLLTCHAGVPPTWHGYTTEGALEILRDVGEYPGFLILSDRDPVV